MAIQLVITNQTDHNSSIKQELDQSLITVGRSQTCHIELAYEEVSRRHFLIKFIDDTYIIMDEGSRHGTVLDGKKLEPHKIYPLANKHQIQIPGFLIELISDGKKPKIEKTMAVARHLLDELLQEQLPTKEFPRLIAQDESVLFNFIEEKASFVLGTYREADFVVTSPTVAKKHVSFARDINGIRLIPLPNHVVLINNQPAKEAQILTDGSLISIGDQNFYFQERAPTAENSKEKLDISLIEPKKEPLELSPPKKTTQFKTLDRIFMFGFILVVLGASIMLFRMV